MKLNYFFIIVILTLSLILLPLPLLFQKGEATEMMVKAQSTDNLTIVMKNGDEVKIPRYDFIFGILCNLNPEYDDETYKAQAVASYTLIKFAENEGDGKIYEDSIYFKDYLNEEAQKKKLGKNFDDTSKRIKDVLGEVYGKTLIYKDKPILALSFEISAGKTESYKTVFGKDIKYLKSVQSVSDLLSPDYQTIITLTAKEVKSALKEEKIKWKDDKSKWFSLPDNSNSGYVITQKVCNKKISGKDLADKLNLPSPYFDVEYSSGKFKFLCRGRGYGVGMSRYGADYMAQNGCNYKEILQWYYKGCSIKE